MPLPSRYFLPAAVVLGIAGCAPTVWTKVGASTQDFTSDQYACERDSRQSGGFGTGIAGAFQVQAYFNRCMGAHGWGLEDKALNQAASVSNKATVSALLGRENVCIQSVRSEAEMLPISSHFADLRTGKYSFSQMSDGNVLTQTETGLMRDYVNQSDSCRDALFAGLAPMLTVSEMTKLQSIRNGIGSQSAQLVRRQISWGEYSTKVNQIQDDAKVNLGVGS